MSSPTLLRLQITLLKSVAMVICLSLVFKANNDVNAYVIRGVHQCFGSCENRYWDCLVFCGLKNANLCERRCEGVFYYCAADCPPYWPKLKRSSKWTFIERGKEGRHNLIHTYISRVEIILRDAQYCNAVLKLKFEKSCFSALFLSNL